jgi:plastocyanin
VGRRRIEWAVGIVLLAAGLAWAAALGGFASGFLSDDPPAVNPYATTPTTTTTPVVVITITGLRFSDPVAISVGQVVTVSNQADVPHTWTDRGGTFDSGSIAGGATFRFVFEQPGTYQFFCRFHASMAGTITVMS